MSARIALTIAGSDSSGGAGIQADLKTFSALGVFGASVITALTAQNTHGVQGVHAVPPDFVRAQWLSVSGDLRLDAVKTGMLATADIVGVVAHVLKGISCPVVVDPVLVAQAGDPLLTDDALDVVRTHLLPCASVLTPNLPEAARLLGTSMAGSEDDMKRQARALRGMGAKAVLLKGGHAQGPDSVDIFDDGQDVMRLSAPRLSTPHTHGTGCALAAAIAAHLAGGFTLRDSVTRSKLWLTHALRAGQTLGIGTGAGPVHHFHALWDK